jgi:hypothetical protein
VIGAAIGGTIGLTAGAREALNRHEAEIAGCLAKRGYRIAGKWPLDGRLEYDPSGLR